MSCERVKCLQHIRYQVVLYQMKNIILMRFTCNLHKEALQRRMPILRLLTIVFKQV